jgi:histidine triad (HIT) family protein
MLKDDCLFCKIVRGHLPSSKFYETDEFIVILDLFPNTKGASLVIPKNHVTSDVFNAETDIVHKGIDVARKAAQMLTKALKPSRVCLITEGVLVDHLHLKLYPIYGVDESTDTGVSDDPVYFDKFPGYLTTKAGPMASAEELDQVLGSILNDRQNRNN